MQPKILSSLLRRYLPIAITVVLVAWIYHAYGAWAYTVENAREFVRFVLEHLFLVVVSLTASIIVGVGLGTIMTRKGFEKTGPAIMTLVNIWQSVPSLGVIALAYGFLPLLGLAGIGVLPALIALFFTAVAPIVRNTYAGIDAVSTDVIEAATGMGMTDRQILMRIELPNALPVIMGGIRTSSAIIVGTAPLAFLIGGGGLGFLIFTGIALMDMAIMISGAVPVALIAMIFDDLLGRLEKIIVSKGIQAEAAQAL